MKLTKRIIDSLAATGRLYTVWDDELRGLGVRVTPRGVRSFVLKYSLRDTQGFLTLGRYGDLTIDQARKEAQRLRAQIALGQDPAQDRREAREALTFEEASRRFLREHAAHVAGSTLKEYEALIKRMVPAFGKRAVRDLALKDVAAFHDSLKATPRQANHALAVLSVLLGYMEKWGERPVGSNPCQLVSRFPETKRERYLNPMELERLGRAITKVEARGGFQALSASAIRLLVLTGARRSEILQLRRSQVDLEGRRIMLGATEHKTGRKAGAKVIPLGDPAVDILRGLMQGSLHPYVFPGIKRGQHLSFLHRVWTEILVEAQLSDLRIHDLRHTFGSAAANSGEALKLIGAVLGHKHQATTERYTHAALTPAQEVAQRTSQKLAEAMGGQTAKKGKPAAS